jgi:hypothetical protein
MSFALAHQSKTNNSRHDRMSTKHSSIHHINNLNKDPSDYVFHLQRTIGNQAVQRIVHPNNAKGFDFAKIGIQPKLKVSQLADEYEKEADRIAEEVMTMSASNHISSTVSNEEERIDRKCSACKMKKEEDEKNLNISRKSSTMSKSETTDKVTNEVSYIHPSGGSPLDNDVRELMESGFGYDFSRVRIHTDERAAESAQSVNALAYTVGQDIVFGPGQYASRTNEGQRLLAHELTHVIQQDKSSDTNCIQRACGKSEVGSTPEGCILESRMPKGMRFLFKVNCDEFAPGEEERFRTFVSTIGPTDTVNILGTASFEGDPEFNNSLSCHRASMAISILKGEGKERNIGSVSATGGLLGTAHQREARAVFIEVLEKPVEPISTKCDVHEVKLVAKSFIAPIGTSIGVTPCFVSEPLSNLAKLQALATATENITKDNPTDDTKDKSYRLYSELKFSVTCLNGKLNIVETNPPDTDIGSEGGLQPPDLIISDAKLTSEDSDTSLHVTWTGKGRPHALAEPGFQLVCPRTSRFIWHTVDAKITCNNKDISVTSSIIGSEFPTHTIFERISCVESGLRRTRGSLKSKTVKQGPFGALWSRHSSDPSMVR